VSESLVIPFDFKDLPDTLSQAEALWHLTALSYVYALGLGYLTLMSPPDRKAAWNPEKAADYLERSVRLAYPQGEAEFLIALARQKAREGVAAQKVAQEASDSALATP
jgi:hypothetical protein